MSRMARIESSLTQARHRCQSPSDQAHDSLPYVIERRFDENAPWESEPIDLYKIRYARADSRYDELLAVRFIFKAAIR